MNDIEHRRRAIRRWLCVCGRRFPCGAFLNRRDQASRQVHPGGTAAAELVGWTIGHREVVRRVVTGGVAIAGREIRVDPGAVEYLHDVDRSPDPDGTNCPMCGETYPCEVLEAVSALTEAIKPWMDKAPAPTGVGDERT